MKTVQKEGVKALEGRHIEQTNREKTDPENGIIPNSKNRVTTDNKGNVKRKEF